MSLAAVPNTTAPIVHTAASLRARSASHLPVLDGIRGLAILLVLLFHFMVIEGVDGVVPWGARLIQKTWGYGGFGVDLFLVLSGFLITGILLDSKNRPGYFRSFYARRTLRIFPLYYGFLILFLLVLPRIVSGWDQLMGKPPCGEWAYWLYVYNFAQGQHDPATFSHSLGVIWSLCIEEQFYLIWPTVVLLSSRRALTVICPMLLAVSLLARTIMHQYGVDVNWIAQFTFTRWDGLAVGSMLAVLYRREDFGRLLKPALATLCVVPILLVVLNYFGGSLQKNPLFVIAGVPVLVAFFGALMVLVLATPATGWPARVFSSPVMVALGKYAYALYMFNQPVKYALLRYVSDPNRAFTLSGSRVPAQLLFALIAGLVSFALAWLSWHLYEKHFLKLKVLFPVPGRDANRAPASASAAS